MNMKNINSRLNQNNYSIVAQISFFANGPRGRRAAVWLNMYDYQSGCILHIVITTNNYELL